MMQIHVARDGKELGSFPLDDVRTGLVSGKFLPTDFGWMDGQPDWARLSALPGLEPAAPAPAPEPLLPEPMDREELAGAELSTSPRATGSHVPVVRRNPAGPASRLAVASLVLGVISLSVIPLLPALPAIVCGHLARRRIRRSEGTLAGDGLALGGLITGYLSLFLFGVIGPAILLLVA